MNTKNIFRTLLVAVILLLGANRALAQNTVVYENANGTELQSGSIYTFDLGKFANANAGDILRIWGVPYDKPAEWNDPVTNHIIRIFDREGNKVFEKSTDFDATLEYYDCTLSQNDINGFNSNKSDFAWKNYCGHIEGEWFKLFKIEIVSGNGSSDDNNGGSDDSNGDGGGNGNDNSEGEQVLWEGTSDGNWWSIDANKFTNATETSVIRVYVNGDNRIYLVEGNYRWTTLWSDTDGEDGCYKGASHYNEAEKCYEFIIGEFLSQITTNGLYIQSKGATITKVTLSFDDDLQTPKHTLTINIDGQQPTTRSVAEGADLFGVLPANPTKTGHTFARWDGVPEDGKMPANDLTVTALFTINSYTLTYMVDGEQYGESETYEYGAEISPKAEPTKNDYTFSGWIGLPATMPDYDVTVTGSFIKERAYVPATINSSTGYATFCSAEPLDFSGITTVTAYYAAAVSDTEVTFKQIRGTVAAGTGLLLKGETSQIPVAETGTPASYPGNLLVGVTTGSDRVSGANLYVLVERNGEPVFAETAATPATVPAGKAYLSVQSSSNSRILTFSFAGESTSISAVETTLTGNEVIYNLRGQRVTTPTKGLYIINGKKVLIK